MRVKEDQGLETGELSSVQAKLTHSLYCVTEQLYGGGAAAVTAGQQLLLVQEARQLRQGEKQQLGPGVLEQLLLVVAMKLLE